MGDDRVAKGRVAGRWVSIAPRVGMAIVCAVCAILLLNLARKGNGMGEAVSIGGSIHAGFVAAISTRKILPNTPLEKLEVRPEVALRAAPGEYEPASFVVANRTAESQTIHVRVSDLRGPAGVTLSGRVDLKHVIVWYQASGAWKNWRRLPRNYDAFLTPELLVNDPALIRVDREAEHNYLKLSKASGPEYLLISERKRSVENVYPSPVEQPVYDAEQLQPIAIPAGEIRQFWVTVHVPDAAAPGKYSASIEIEAGPLVAATLSLNLEVYEFALPAPKLEYSMYYRGKLADHNPTVSHEWKSTAQLTADLEAMIRHGVSNPASYQRLWPKVPVEHASPVSTRSLVVRYLEIRQRLGLVDRPLYYLGRGTGNRADRAHLEAVRRDTLTMLELAEAHGATDLYVYAVDEAKKAGVSQQYSAWIAAKGTGAKVFAAGHGDHLDHDAGLTDLLVYVGRPSREVAAEQHRRGKRVFMYGYPQSGPEDPLLWRVRFGIMVWQADYDGVMPFAFQSQFGEVWNDWDDKHYRAAMLTYPTVTHPISTLAFEGFREAVDDVRYLTALEQAIARARREGRSGAPLNRARAFLAQSKELEDFDPEAIRLETVARLRSLLE